MQSTRDQLIQLLKKHDGAYISGQMLSEKLNISRSAVWKQMKGLEKAGYQIEGKTNRGYRILSYPNNINAYTLQWGLSTKWIGQKIVHKETTASTQIIAHQLAQDNAAHGTVVIADEQTAAKGRMNRSFYSKKNKGIWMSIVLRPPIFPYQAPQFTLLTATVLADVIADHIGIRPQIKWPNDILMGGKKLAGILTEMQAEQDSIQYIVIGIGLNVNQDQIHMPNDIKDKATSLHMETNKSWNLLEISQKILQTFEERYTNYIDNGFHSIKNKWESYGYKIDKTISIKTSQDSWQATFLGIAEDGALLTKTDKGKIEKVYSAEIDWFKEEH